jgi:hypothetical protein
VLNRSHNIPIYMLLTPSLSTLLKIQCHKRTCILTHVIISSYNMTFLCTTRVSCSCIARKETKDRVMPTNLSWGALLWTTLWEFPGLWKWCSQATGVAFVFCVLRVKHSAMDFTKSRGLDLRASGKNNMVVFDHSKPSRKNTPICKSAWSKNITILPGNTGNAWQENRGLGPGPEAPTHIATKKTAHKQQLHWHTVRMALACTACTGDNKDITINQKLDKWKAGT